VCPHASERGCDRPQPRASAPAARREGDDPRHPGAELRSDALADGLSMLPRQHPCRKKSTSCNQYVIAIHEEFVHANYEKVATFPEGFLYRRK
jgi:hypothetical protein